MRITALSLCLALLAAAGCSDGRRPVDTPTNPRIANAIDLGGVSRDTPFDFVLGLRLRTPERLHKFLADQRFTRDALTPGDFGDQFGVSPAEYWRMVTWLRGQGLTVTRLEPSRTTISVHGTAEVIERVFGTEIHEFQDAAGRFSATVSQLQLAPEISSVSGSAGLAGGDPWVSHLFRPTPNAVTTPYGAQDIESLYGTTAIASPGMGEQVVILGTGNPPAATDLSGYVASLKPYNLTTFPGTYKQEFIGGMNRDDAQTAQDEQLENVLDVEMVAAMAPYATIYHVLTATNSPGLFTDGISYIVNQHAAAHAVTVSYGTCERGSAGEMPLLNALFMQAKAEGQTWFFAAGDTGTDGCRDGSGNKIISAGWPASSPYVIGVGGTQINTGTTEVVWDSWGVGMNGIPGAGGGGASESLDKPAYQVGVTPDDSARDEPDVAALAGPPYITVYQGGNSGGVAGTSAAAPMWAGAWALLEQGKNHALITNAHEGLYMLGKGGKGFHDVTSGNNGGVGDTTTGGYTAAMGYDLATGWGSPNVPALIQSWP